MGKTVILKNKLVLVAVSISLILGFNSCGDNTNLVIEPISVEFNGRFLTGEGLDTHYFSTTDVMQYYQISGFEDIPSKELLAKLSNFVDTHYPLSKMTGVNELTVLFYQKRMFVDYSDHLFESARENENRRLEGYSDDLVAFIGFERSKKDRTKVTLRKVIYQ